MVQPAHDQAGQEAHRAARRRAWQAATAVCGIIVLATAAGVYRLAQQPAAKRSSSQTGSLAKAGPSSTTPQVALPAVKWKLSWDDEFNGKGAPGKPWTLITGGGGWGHKALQYYDTSAVQQDGKGNLVITADKSTKYASQECGPGPCDYVSGRLQTQGNFAQRYGRFTARIRLPVGAGIWPAFWLMRENATKRGDPKYGEIDVIETQGGWTKTVQGHLHAVGHHLGQKLVTDESLDRNYHTYGVDWTPTSVTYWVDGKVYFQVKKYPGWTFNSPFFMILQVQVGGYWPGPPNSTTRFPARMYVDWVRVYRAT